MLPETKKIIIMKKKKEKQRLEEANESAEAHPATLNGPQLIQSNERRNKK